MVRFHFPVCNGGGIHGNGGHAVGNNEVNHGGIMPDRKCNLAIGGGYRKESGIGGKDAIHQFGSIRALIFFRLG